MLAALLALAGGCGRGGPELVPVRGTVTLDGKPVEGASVTFIPQFPGQPALGSTDARGKFTLKTHPHGNGAMPGTHKATVRKVETTGFLATEDGLSGGVAPEGIQQIWHTPQRYADPETTPLLIEVGKRMEAVSLALTSDEHED
jgi:hypothetical protein